MLRHPWLPDIIAESILEKNPGGTLTNSNLKLGALILHDATLLNVCPEVNMDAPRSGLDNTPTVSCSTWEASAMNLVVADLLCMQALHSQIVLSIPLSSTTQARRIAWRMTYLNFYYLKPRFLHTCLPPTSSRNFRCNSAPCFRNCFYA